MTFHWQKGQQKKKSYPAVFRLGKVVRTYSPATTKGVIKKAKTVTNFVPV